MLDEQAALSGGYLNRGVNIYFTQEQGWHQWYIMT